MLLFLFALLSVVLSSHDVSKKVFLVKENRGLRQLLGGARPPPPQ